MNSNNSTTFFKSNVEKLLKRYPAFQKDILDKYSPTNDLEVSETADGLLTARIDNLWIHSSRQPKKEAQRLVSRGITKKTGICLVYGLGLGYHVESILEEFPDLQIIVIEPEPELFLRVLELKDFSAVIESEQVGLLLKTDAAAVSSILNQFKTVNFQSIKLRSLYERNIDYYNGVDEELSSFIRKRETNMNTLNRFGKTWTRNLFRNIEVFRDARDSGAWYEKFTGCPALVIAAGPSLDELLPRLLELQKRFVIICVDTALSAVTATGVVPDFIVVVDPQYLNTRHLDNLLTSKKLSSSVLISESSTHPAVFRSCTMPVFFFRSVFPLGKLIDRNAGIISELGAGGSVATTAWDFARRLGCSEIYTAGLDLGYPGKRTHCRTSLSSMYTQLKTSRKTSVDSINFAGLTGADPHPEPNNSGGETMTDKRLIIYKWWFEGQIKAGSDSRLYNLSEHGISINGMEYTDADSLLEKPELRPEIDGLITDIISKPADSEAGDSGWDRVHLLVQTIIKECGRLEDICRSALLILNETKTATDEELIKDGLNSLSALDVKISDSPSKELTGFIIQPVLNEIIDEEKSMFENSEKLYSSILEACEYHRVHAERALKRMA